MANSCTTVENDSSQQFILQDYVVLSLLILQIVMPSSRLRLTWVTGKLLNTASLVLLIITKQIGNLFLKNEDETY